MRVGFTELTHLTLPLPIPGLQLAFRRGSCLDQFHLFGFVCVASLFLFIHVCATVLAFVVCIHQHCVALAGVDICLDGGNCHHGFCARTPSGPGPRLESVPIIIIHLPHALSNASWQRCICRGQFFSVGLLHLHWMRILQKSALMPNTGARRSSLCMDAPSLTALAHVDPHTRQMYNSDPFIGPLLYYSWSIGAYCI